MRTCIICRKKAPKSKLHRYCLVPGAEEHQPRGRGAYVCPEHDARQIAKNKKRFAKALRCEAAAMHIHLNGEIRS